METEAETITLPRCPVTGRILGEPATDEIHMFAASVLADAMCVSPAEKRAEARRLSMAIGLMGPAGMPQARTPRQRAIDIWVDVPMLTCNDRSQDVDDGPLFLTR